MEQIVPSSRHDGAEKLHGSPVAWLHRRGIAVLLPVTLLWVLTFVLAPGALIVLDEVVYYASAHAVLERGSLILENGWDIAASGDLRIQHLVAIGPDGLVSQYPSGYAILGAPMLALGGIKGLMVLNLAAAIGCLWLCRRLALAVTGGDRRVADLAVVILGLGTYLSSYTATLMPHAPAALSVLAATLFAVRAGDPDAAAPRRDTFLLALAISAGLLFRIDGVLALPALGLWLLLRAPRPLALVMPGLAGLVPGIAVLSVTNAIKFGTWNPLSYGSSGGGTALGTYAVLLGPALAAVAVCIVLVWAVRGGWRPGRRTVVVAGLGTVALAGLATLLVPAFGTLAARLAHGFWVLLIDFRATTETRVGTEYLPDGSVMHWGFFKKALLQSLPWLAALPLLLLPGGPRASRGVVALFLGLVVTWTLPFALSAWHGSVPGVMRYLTPLLPQLSILGAIAWYRLGAAAGELGDGPRPVVAAMAMAIPVAIILLLGAGTLPNGGEIEQRWSLRLAVALGVASLVVVAAHGRASARMATSSARLLVIVAFGYTSLVANGADFGKNILMRLTNELRQDRYRELPERSLVYVQFGSPFAFLIDRPDSAMAFAGRFADAPDMQLIDAALDRGMRVFMQKPQLIEHVLATDPSFGTSVFLEEYLGFPPVVELTRSAAGGEDGRTAAD